MGVGLDPDSGKVDLTSLSTGKSNSDRKKLGYFHEIFKALVILTQKNTIPLNDLVDEMIKSEKWNDKEDAMSYLSKLRSDKQITIRDDIVQRINE